MEFQILKNRNILIVFALILAIVVFSLSAPCRVYYCLLYLIYCFCVVHFLCSQSGKTAGDVAEANGHLAIVEYLGVRMESLTVSVLDSQCTTPVVWCYTEITM